MIPISDDIRVEITTFCNYNCILCRNDKLKRNYTFMDLDLFRYLIRKIVKETDQYKYVTFAGIGESMMHLNLVDMVRVVKENGLIPLLVTNGSYLSIDNFLELQDAGLDLLRVSFHGGTLEGYTRVHGVTPETYQKVKSTVKQIIDLPDRTTKVYLTYVVVDGENDEGQDLWLKLWEKADSREIWRVHNWVDCFNYRSIEVPRKATCGRVYHGPLQIQVDGTVNMCCLDYDGVLTLGDLKRESLRQIFESDLYHRLVEAHTTNNHKGLLCEHCDQRNKDKSEALIYSSDCSNKNDRINRTSSARTKLSN